MKVGNRLAVWGILLGCTLALPISTSAQAWKPDRNVEVVAAAGAGGPQDTTARLMQRIFQSNRLVEPSSSVVNKPGGGGSVAWAYLSQHPADAHFIAVTSVVLLSNHIVGVSKFNHADFTPLANLYGDNVAIAVRADSPLRTAKDLVERFKRSPESLSIGTANALGNPNHVAAAMVMKAAGGDIKRMKTVIFQAGSETVTALLGGHVDLISINSTTVLQQMQAGKLRVLGVAALRRLTGDFAAVPTFQEQGVNAVSVNWRGVIGPKNMSSGQVAYWDETLGKMIQSVEWKQALEKFQWEADYMNSSAARKYYDSEYRELQGILQGLGLVKP